MWPIRPAHWVGRGHELAVLRAAIEALGRGEGTVVWVEGEPGIGKSSLVAEALAAVSQPERDVGWAGAEELIGRLPLRVMQTAFRSGRARRIRVGRTRRACCMAGCLRAMRR